MGCRTHWGTVRALARKAFPYFVMSPGGPPPSHISSSLLSATSSLTPPLLKKENPLLSFGKEGGVKGVRVEDHSSVIPPPHSLSFKFFYKRIDRERERGVGFPYP